MDIHSRQAAPPQNQPGTRIHFRGRSYTIADASALAIKEYQLRKFQAAADLYRHILVEIPGDAAAHNNLGKILQAMKRPDEALASYDQAIALKPDGTEAHNNRGATLQEMQRFDEALASYDRAIALKPDSAEAHNNRGVTLKEMRRYDEALASYAQSLALKLENPSAYNNRGVVLKEMKWYAEALADYDQAIALKPDYAEAYNNRGVVLHNLKRYEEALASYDRTITLMPDNAEVHNNRGITLQKLKRYEEALASYDQALALKPDYAEACVNRGGLMVVKGDMPNAEKMFSRALSVKHDLAASLFNLTCIRKYQNTDHADVKSIRNLLEKPGISPDEKDYLYFALGKTYDDCGLYDEAFECYRLANWIRNATVSYDPVGVQNITNRIAAVFSWKFLAQPFAFAPETRFPLFVVGMPRSGTTLIASMLSNHRSIATAGELPTVIEYASRLGALTGSGLPYPEAARQMTPEVAAHLIRVYEQRLRRDVGPGILHVIDKHPLNFRHLGFISILFPKARIIHCTRHPLDTGLSNYFQRFETAYDYSFDLRNIGHFYGEYARLMAHWRNVLPVEMIEISYEEMVTNTEPVARQTLAALGLDWDEHCLAPHTNPCAVETASQWQVRQPIYRQSLERWRHYEKYLAPLKAALPVPVPISR